MGCGLGLLRGLGLECREREDVTVEVDIEDDEESNSFRDREMRRVERGRSGGDGANNPVSQTRG